MAYAVNMFVWLIIHSGLGIKWFDAHKTVCQRGTDFDLCFILF